MTPDFHVATRHVRHSLAVAEVAGDLDYHTAPALRTHALDLVEQGHPHLILDLERVTFCDSSALNALIGILRYTQGNDGSLVLSAVPGRLQRLLDITGMSGIVSEYPTTDDALAAHGRHGASAP